MQFHMNCNLHFYQVQLNLAFELFEIDSGMNVAINKHSKIFDLIYNSNLSLKFGSFWYELKCLWVTVFARIRSHGLIEFSAILGIDGLCVEGVTAGVWSMMMAGVVKYWCWQVWRVGFGLLCRGLVFQGCSVLTRDGLGYFEE
jgi:hypothetical protein